METDRKHKPGLTRMRIGIFAGLILAIAAVIFIGFNLYYVTSTTP